MRYAEVVVMTGTRMTDRRFTYEVPESLDSRVAEGKRVIVPFGRGDRKTPALVLSLTGEKPGFSTKPILSVADEAPMITRESVEIARYMIEENLSDYTSAFTTVFPPGGIGQVRPILKYFYRLSGEGETAEPAKNALRQRKVLDCLREEGELERSVLLSKTGASTQTLKGLEEKGWIEVSTRRKRRRTVEHVAGYAKMKLTEPQREVFEKIDGTDGHFLLCGVTGSGKTEIYLQLAEAALNRGQEAIVLVPEISLTPQTIARFQGRFGDQIAVLHSRLSVAERFEEWERIRSGEVSIAIGARSAIFAPFENLGLIVIDEEHEQSYASDKNPKYHATDIAAFRCRYHKCPLVLGSATPSMETLYRVETGEFTRLNLPSRVLGREMPAMRIIDMCEELRANNRTMFSRDLYQAMNDALARKEQVILFLNKRGHTSFVFCRACGYVYRCDACDVAMTYHKHRNRLICHYCGREKSYTRKCPQCGSEAVKEFGAGTEMLEEEVRKYFPNARVVRADADTMTSKGAYDRIYRDMNEGRIDILLGTQMIAKGFDFPRVTVVGIISADITLNLPDLRAAERTFQLITQVAGRAGRGTLPGSVFIQTYKPDHYAIRHAAEHDVDAFYQDEIRMRRINAYPPLSTEVHVGVSGKDRRASWACCEKIRDSILKRFGEPVGMRFEGPMPAVVERINGRYRFVMVLRSADADLLKEIGRFVIERFPSGEELRVIVSVNPRSFL